MDVRSPSYSHMAIRYAESVVAGGILACRWVQRACQRQLDDLAHYKGEASPAYRQALRDITEQSDPFNIAWPGFPRM